MIPTSTARSFAPLLAFALALPVLGCGGGAAEGGGAKSPLIGAAAPDFKADYIVGDGPKTLKDAQGRVTILDFWGTFCEPCKKSFPKYQEIVDQFPGEVTVLAVSVDDPDSVKKEQIEAFAKENHAKFAILWDKDHAAAKKYNMDTLTMPSSYIIDKAGNVRYLHVGFKDGEEAKVAEEVKELIGK
ncbi:MAG: peroxiredoxin family protein [Byssovorax sp.]